MSYQVVIGLRVLDHRKFAQYCTALEPVLASHGGEFCYNFNVPEMLASKSCKNINQMFTLNFSSKEKMECFFADRNYLKIRGRHILKTIGSEQIIFGYHKEVVVE